jgi:hypothetical protein
MAEVIGIFVVRPQNISLKLVFLSSKNTVSFKNHCAFLSKRWLRMSDIGQDLDLTRGRLKATRANAANVRYIILQQTLIDVFLAGESTCAVLGAGEIVKYKLKPASDLAYCALQRVYEGRGLYVRYDDNIMQFSRKPFTAEC